MASEDSTTTPSTPQPLSPFWSRILPYVGAGSAVFFFICIAVAAYLVVKPVSDGFGGIDQTDYARGLITVLFSFGTILIAASMVFYRFFSTAKDSEERFDRAKEVLTILIGVFGTIMGFYFGKADDGPTNRDVAVAEQQVEELSQQLLKLQAQLDRQSPVLEDVVDEDDEFFIPGEPVGSDPDDFRLPADPEPMDRDFIEVDPIDDGVPAPGAPVDR